MQLKKVIFPKFRIFVIMKISGKESKTNWKWYNMMEDLAQAEAGLRESFDGNKVIFEFFLTSIN